MQQLSRNVVLISCCLSELQIGSLQMEKTERDWLRIQRGNLLAFLLSIQ